MSEFKIKVVGQRRPRRSNGLLSRMAEAPGRTATAVLMRPKLLVLAALAAGLAFGGTPHIGWDYACNHPMRGSGTCQSVAWCAYYGIQGRRVKIPANGAQCSLVTFLPLRSDERPAPPSTPHL